MIILHNNGSKPYCLLVMSLRYLNPSVLDPVKVNNVAPHKTFMKASKYRLSLVELVENPKIETLKP